VRQREPEHPICAVAPLRRRLCAHAARLAGRGRTCLGGGRGGLGALRPGDTGYTFYVSGTRNFLGEHDASCANELWSITYDPTGKGFRISDKAEPDKALDTEGGKVDPGTKIVASDATAARRWVFKRVG
jgi:hypothetical protein